MEAGTGVGAGLNPAPTPEIGGDRTPDQIAKVTPAVHPSHQQDLLANVLCPEASAYRYKLFYLAYIQMGPDRTLYLKIKNVRGTHKGVACFRKIKAQPLFRYFIYAYLHIGL